MQIFEKKLEKIEKLEIKLKNKKIIFKKNQKKLEKYKKLL